MEHVAIRQHRARRGRRPLQQIVVVGVDTSYHVLPHTAVEQSHERRLLSPFQSVGARRQHHFKVACGVFKARQHGTPEEHVVVTLYVSHDASARLSRVQAVGRLNISRRYVLVQAFHVFTY